MTAKDEAGKQYNETKKIYMPQCTDSLGPRMVLGPDKKLGIIRDTTIQPFAPKREEFQVHLKGSAKAVDLELRLSYVLRPGDEIPVHVWRKRIPVEDLLR